MNTLKFNKDNKDKHITCKHTKEFVSRQDNINMI